MKHTPHTHGSALPAKGAEAIAEIRASRARVKAVSSVGAGKNRSKGKNKRLHRYTERAALRQRGEVINALVRMHSARKLRVTIEGGPMAGKTVLMNWLAGQLLNLPGVQVFWDDDHYLSDSFPAVTRLEFKHPAVVEIRTRMPRERARK